MSPSTRDEMVEDLTDAFMGPSLLRDEEIAAIMCAAFAGDGNSRDKIDKILATFDEAKAAVALLDFVKRGFYRLSWSDEEDEIRYSNASDEEKAKIQQAVAAFVKMKEEDAKKGKVK
jgi:hypothetical protein